MVSAGVIGLICGAVIGLFFPLLISLALYICGFGCGGVLAAVCCCNCSIAASVMSAIHPVASGSAYACKFHSTKFPLVIITDYDGKDWVHFTIVIDPVLRCSVLRRPLSLEPADMDCVRRDRRRTRISHRGHLLRRQL